LVALATAMVIIIGGRRVHAGDLTIDEAAVSIVAVVDRFGLQAVEEPPLPERVAVDDLGVVCWMAVLPPA